ncbi:hypothetical protein CCHR01_08930 [Colletotrichum chrysophilum]|uniref:Uncharacterized protein n=1 Tax=Colletotrichum chrysophilum TaxID=1836956 RepID=A0AAD9AHM2_9PEZI|nr:hypothetical protein CCHR01_08930 [Colletotrichum chrysophilum]
MQRTLSKVPSNIHISAEFNQMMDNDFRPFTNGVMKRLILSSVFGIHRSTAVEKTLDFLAILINDGVVQLRFVIFSSVDVA